MSVTTFKTILICAFVTIILIAILAGLIGFLKGIYKTALKTILKTILILILVFVSPGLSNFLGSINIQQILHSESAITLQTYLANLLTSTGLFSPVNGLSIYATVFAITNSFLSFVVFFLGMLFIQISASPLTFLLYNGIFRWFLPVEDKKERKKRKSKDRSEKISFGLVDSSGKVVQTPKRILPLLRIPGCLLGGIQEFLFVIILLCPFSALSTIALNKKETIKNVMKSTGSSEENISLYNLYLDEISDSALYKTTSLFGFDSLLMNFVSSVPINGVNVSFNGLVDSVLDVADPLFKDGTVSYDRQTKAVSVNFALLLSLNSIDGIIDSMISNPMILSLIPPFIDIGMNSLSGKYFSLDELDFSHIDWSDELKVIKSIYAKVYSCIQPMVFKDKVDPTNFFLKTSQLSEEEISLYVKALSEAGKLDIVKKNLPSILSSAGVYLHQLGYDIFPTEISAYDGVDWSKELEIAGDIGFHFLKTIEYDLSSKMSSYDLKDHMLKALKDTKKRAEIEEFIISSDRMTGVVDMQLFDILSISGILSSTLSVIPSLNTYIKDIDLQTVLKDMNKQKYREEFKIFFKMLDNLFAEDSTIDFDNLLSTDLGNPKTTSQLVDLLLVSKKSVIFQNIYPKLLKSILFQNKFEFSDFLFGLTPYNFNYDSEDFIDIFSSFLSLTPKIEEMRKIMADDELSLDEKINKIDTDFIREILSLVTQSDFFNSDQRLGFTSTRQKNVNIHTFLSNLFSTSLFSKIGFVTPSLEEVQDITWMDVGSTKGEVSILCDIFDDLKKTISFFASDDKNLDNISDLNAVGDMISKGMDSKIFAPSILNIIDSSIRDFFHEIGLPVSLNDLRNQVWKDDSENITKLLKLLKEIGVKNLNPEKLDPLKANAFLTLLHSMNLIQNQNFQGYEDNFGYLLYSFLKNQLGNSEALISDPSILQLKQGDEDKWVTRSKKVMISSKEYTITEEGEIKNLCDLLEIFQRNKISLDGSDIVLTSSLISDLSDVLNSELVRKIVGNYGSKYLDQLEISDSFKPFLDSIDFASFSNLSTKECQKELSLFLTITHFAKDDFLGTTRLQYIPDHVFELSDVMVDKNQSLLDEFLGLFKQMWESKLLNQKKEFSLMTPNQYFLFGFLKSACLQEQITLVDNPSYKDSVLKEMILNSSSIDKELVCLESILTSLQGIGKEFDFALLNESKAQSILTTMNESDIFYRYPIYLIKQAFEKAKFENYLKNVSKSGILHPFDFYQHLSKSARDKAFWKNDIDYLIKVLYEDGLSIYFSKDSDISKLDIASAQNVSLVCFYHLSKMHLFDERRASYFFYNLLADSCSGYDLRKLFDKSSNPSYLEDDIICRIDELLFSNPKLLNQDKSIEEKNFSLDLQLFKNTVSSLAKKLNSLKEDEIDFDFEALFAHAYFIKSDSSVYQSDISCEFLAGMMKEVFSNNKFLSFLQGGDEETKNHILSFDFYEKDHYFINPIEGRGLNAILLLSKKKESGDFVFSFKELKTLFILAGTKNAKNSLVSEGLLSHFLSQSDYSNGNSSLLPLLKEQLSVLPVKKTDGSLSTLKDVDPLPFNSLNRDSFEEVILKYQSEIQ